MIDEEAAHLGEALKLPPWMEPSRSEIEKGLQVVKLQTEKFMD